VRREGGTLATYVHVGFGNYHPVTARVYTDLSFFTADKVIARDVGRIFNFITGYAEPAELRNCYFAGQSADAYPQSHRPGNRACQGGRPAAIWMKMNSLVDPEIIDDSMPLRARAYRSILWCAVSVACDPACRICRRISGSSRSSAASEHGRIYCFGAAMDCLTQRLRSTFPPPT
jgi:polyphosphate kinase